jgi:hypothetical protein
MTHGSLRASVPCDADHPCGERCEGISCASTGLELHGGSLLRFSRRSNCMARVGARGKIGVSTS